MKKLCVILAMCMLVGCVSMKPKAANNMLTYDKEGYEYVEESQVDWVKAFIDALIVGLTYIPIP
jgi:hypothetical protein